jgi:hypothetical protein
MSDPRLTPARPDLAAAHLKGQVSAARFAEAQEMAVAWPWADLIDQPGGHLVSQLLFGDRFDVYETGAWFAWGQNRRDGYVGYVAARALHKPGPAPNMRVTANWAHVYPRPSLKVPTDRPALPFMAAVHAGDEIDGYCHVEDGFCPVRSLAAADDPVADHAGFAERMSGSPYFWGGCTPAGFDCSGLVQITLLAAGVNAPRDADQQEAAVGVDLGENEPLRRGDLVFWPGHAGIMRDAGILIHANAFHMAVASEPLAEAIGRIGPPRSRRRVSR